MEGEVKKHAPGTVCYLRQSLVEGPKELLTVLWDIEPEEDEVGPKYLTRTAAHSKKVVFHCEIKPVNENGECPSPGG